MNESRFLSWVQPTQFILAVLVVFIHSYNASAYDLSYNNGLSTIILYVEDIISQDLAHISVPLFFAISGYLFYRDVNIYSLWNKLKRRTKSLLLPFVLWNIIYFVLFYLITHIPSIQSLLSSVERVELSGLNIIKGVMFYKYNYIMWFVYQLIIYTFILSPFIIYVLRNKIIFLFIICILGIMYSFSFLEIPPLSHHSLGIGVYPDMLAYYCIGAYLGKYKCFPEQSKKIGIILVTLAQIVWIINRDGFKTWHYNYLNFIFCFFSILGVLFIIFGLKRSFNMNCSFLSCSFYIFAIHPFVLECVQKINYMIFPHNNLFALLDYMLSPMLTILISILLALNLKKYQLKMYHLFGGR